MNMRDFENLYSGYDDMIYCSIGQPGYAVDAVILNTIIESLKNPYQKYPTKKGNQKLIEAIANKYNCSKSIVITHGASEALMMSLLSIFKSDGTLLIPSPSYPAYFSICKALGIKFKESLCCFPQYRLNFDDWQNENIKAVILISSGNPTGVSLNKKDWFKAAEICRENNWILILDESYQLLEERLPDPHCRFLRIGSFSKSHGMAGLRIGWVQGDEKLINQIGNLVSLNTVGVAPPIQDGAAAACRISSDKLAYQLKNNAQRLISLLKKYHIPCAPSSGFYCYFDVSSTNKDGWEFCDQCAKEENVLFMPGEFFGSKQKYMVRACCAVKEFDEVLVRLERFLVRI